MNAFSVCIASGIEGKGLDQANITLRDACMNANWMAVSGKVTQQ